MPLSLPCPEDVFLGVVRAPQTKWLVENCRRALDYAGRDDVTSWPQTFGEEFMKFVRDQSAKPRAGKVFAQMTQQEKLAAFAKSLKNRLPAAIFQAGGFAPSLSDKAREKAQAEGLSREQTEAMMRPWVKQRQVRLNGLVMLDIDHVVQPRAVFEGWRGRIDLAREGILLVYLTPSMGLRVVMKARMEWGNLIDNQRRMSELLGVNGLDESCKDASRRAFLTTEEDILYMDKEIFTYENKAFGERYNAEYWAGHNGPAETAPAAATAAQQGTGGGGTVDAQAVAVSGSRSETDGGEGERPQWRGHDLQAIIDARYAGKLPCRADKNRHNESLKLASDLLLMLDGDKQMVRRIVERQSWVREIIDERGEDVAQTVESAAKQMSKHEAETASPYPSKAMQTAISQATGRSYREIVAGAEQQGGREAETAMDRMLEQWGGQIEELAADFPLLRDICKGLKRNQYAAALFVGGGLLMTLMTRCTYRFYHRPEELRRLNCSTLIIGDPASGKSFATRLFRLLTAPLRAADKAGMEAINRYKEEVRTKAANKEKPQKPKAIVRMHPARTSNAQFIQDMVNAVECVDGEEMQLHMLTFDTELDNTLSVQKGGAWIDKQSLELKAFHNEEDGQAYSNLESIMQNFAVTWNFIYTGTPLALKKKVNERNFGSGLATRLTCIPLPATNFEMMERESRIDTESDGRLKAAAFKLNVTKGELTVGRIVDALYDWTARRMEDAKENNSRADEMLLKRCAYHGLNFAAPFIVLRHWDKMHQDGQYWCGEFDTDETDWQLTELLTNIQYACQRHFFGALAEKYFDDKTRDYDASRRHQQKTLEGFNRLPEIFDRDDVKRCFNNESKSFVCMKLKRLTDDHLIEPITDGEKKGMYRKTGVMLD